jgi:hypothetical protein
MKGGSGAPSPLAETLDQITNRSESNPKMFWDTLKKLQVSSSSLSSDNVSLSDITENLMKALIMPLAVDMMKYTMNWVNLKSLLPLYLIVIQEEVIMFLY